MDQLQEWITYIFDHPVTQPKWYFADDAPEWQGAPEDIPALIAETFEHGGELPAWFSDEQLDQGFRFVIGGGPPDHILTLVDSNLPMATRLRALKSFVPLFEQVMATRCSLHLSHLDEQPANLLNQACYMWWDLLWYQFSGYDPPQKPERVRFDTEILATLGALLAIPHDACRESALHGLGHWARYYPQVAGIIDEFLALSPSLRPELIAYAEHAKIGNVL